MNKILSKITKILKDNIWIFKPSFWCMIDNYSSEADKIINDIMYNERIRADFIERRYHHEYNSGHPYINLDLGYMIWLVNYPYRYAVVTKKEGVDTRPSRKTIYKFKKFIDNIRTNYPECFL